MYLFGFGIPLILHHSSIFLKGQLDRVFIYHKFSEEDLGLYAMGAQIAMILAIVVQALNKATLPYFYEALKQKKLMSAISTNGRCMPYLLYHYLLL